MPLSSVRTAAAAALLVALAGMPAWAQKAPAAVPGKASLRSAVREIEAASGFVRDGDVQLQYGTDTGLLRHLYRRTPPGPVSKAMPARVAAENFLAAHAAELGLASGGGTIQVELTSEKASLSGTHYRYDQVVDGVPVYRAEVVVKVAQDGEVSSVHSTLRPGLLVKTTPALDAAAALAVGQAAVQPTGKAIGDFTAKLSVVETPAGGRLAWLVSVPVEAPMGDWLVFVDAQTGAMLGVEDRMQYVDGTGRVFDPDPRTKLNNTTFIDNSDADSAVPFPGAYDTRALLGITQTGSIYSLSGPYAKIIEFESPVSTPVTTSDPNAFLFQRNAQGFEDVNCYFHIDQNQRYIQSLGFANVNNRIQEIDSHGLSGADNSHYIPSSKRLAFGEGGVDDAEDADVVVHEYGHSIQDNIVPGWGGDQEGQMGEGFGDYWAGSYSYSINPTFEPSFCFNWDGHNAFWPGRVLVDSTMHYPQNCCGEVHASGTLWSSGLTDCLRRVGRTVMDKLVLDHHFALGTSATMADAANQVIQSDIDFYGGAHLATLVPVLGFWGFVNPANFVPTIAHSPVGDTNDTTGPYPVVATVTTVQPLASVKLYYGTTGVFTDSLVMTATGNPNEYSASIPGPLTGVVVRYYIRARDVNGGTAVKPTGAPGTFNSFHIGPNNGGISGRVHLAHQVDNSGVLVTLTPGGASTVSTLDGSYAFSGLFVDSYKITASKAGFAAATKTGVPVQLATTTEYQDLVLFEQLQLQACVAPNQLVVEGVFGISNIQNVTNNNWNVLSLECDVNITHPSIGDLIVELRHGSKTVRLHNQTGVTADNIIGTYPTTLTVSGPGALSDFVGDSANGSWILRVVDPVTDGSNGRLVSWCVRLNGPANVATDAGPIDEIAALAQSEPNPAPDGMATIRFGLPRAASGSLTVFDVAGHRVRLLASGVLAAGRHSAQWDGRDDHGSPVPAGVYFYRLAAGEALVTRKLVVVR